MLKQFPDRWFRNAEKKATRDSFGERLRRQIVGLLHSGRLRPGDRLPSIRELAGQSGVDHRVVSRAYRALAEEDLVEIRPTAGVFVSAGGATEAAREQPADWLAELLLGAWERQVSRSSVLELVRQCSSRGLQCGCIESNEDHMVALTGELETDFSLEPVPLLLDPGRGAESIAADQLHSVDLIVTSVFHVDTARRMGAEIDKPVVVATFHPEFTREVDRRLRERPVTTVHVDEEYAARGREYLAVTTHRDRVRFVGIDELEGKEIDLEAPDVMVTRAARRRLGLPDFHLIAEQRVISPEAARNLCCTITELSLR